jgi:signal transduction histidine kinase
VRHLVELQGGRVRAENRPDGGARFTIALPRTGAVRS